MQRYNSPKAAAPRVVVPKDDWKPDSDAFRIFQSIVGEKTPNIVDKLMKSRHDVSDTRSQARGPWRLNLLP
jgi:hypothetical protein